MPIATIESLDQEGRGVAHNEGKVVFVEGALPGETVEYSSFRKKPSYEFANLSRIIEESTQRVKPRCPHFSMCGGCSMQHLDERAQVAVKQRVLEDNLRHIGKVRPQTILPAIHGLSWGYRQRARFSVRHVEKKGEVLVGFREKKSHFVADIKSCAVLPKKISDILLPLRNLIQQLSVKRHVPQVELAMGEEVDVLSFRILQALDEKDEKLLRGFADKYHVQVFLQPQGPESLRPFHPIDSPALYYSLPEFNVKMPFNPAEFTQVNPAINRLLVKRAIELLEPKKGERIADLFCGLGNFTLPIARSGAEVLGIEGSQALVKRATENADKNGLDNARFMAADLFKIDAAGLKQLGKFDKMLIDPPRTGAMELASALGEGPPAKIVYVSCNPATLARDADILVNAKGYILEAAGAVNMFPHTSHVESIALFSRRPT